MIWKYKLILINLSKAFAYERDLKFIKSKIEIHEIKHKKPKSIQVVFNISSTSVLK